MRELVLESAYRGRLVQPEAADGTVKTLESAIQEEQKHRKINGKKAKPLSYVSQDEVPFEVAPHWQWVCLGGIGIIFNGNSVNAAEKERKYFGATGRPYIATKDVGYGYDPLDYENGVCIPETEEKFKVAPSGSVLICAEGGSAGRKCGLAEQDICFGNKLFANVPLGGIDPKFFLYWYLTPSFQAAFRGSMTGIIGGISVSKFLELPIPLPPLAEQKRIVAKVDELMAWCDQLEAQQQARDTQHAALARASLNRFAQAPTPANLNFLFHPSYHIQPADLRKTILTLAVQGKLVPQDPGDEPAQKTIKRNHQLKEKLIGDKIYRRPRKHSPLSDGNLPFPIPASWKWQRLGDIGNAVDSAIVDGPFGQAINVKTDYLKQGVPVIRMVNVKPFKFIANELRFISPDKFTTLRRHNILTEDVLLGKVGSIGLCALYPDSMPEGMLATTGLCRFRVGQVVTPQYLCQFLNGIADQLRALASEAVQPFLNMKTIGAVAIPLPPLAEQRRIVAKVDQLMALVDELETQLAESRATAQKLLERLVAELTTDGYLS